MYAIFKLVQAVNSDQRLVSIYWHLKQNKKDFTIKWTIIKKPISYTGGSKICHLCLAENVRKILKEKNNYLLNKRLEIVSACQRKNRFQVNNLNKETNACYLNIYIYNIYVEVKDKGVSLTVLYYFRKSCSVSN